MQYDSIDTETLSGACRIIADSKEYRLVNNFDDILNFITERKHRSKILWSYNLGYDVTAIIKPLLLENKEYWIEIANDIMSKTGFNYGDYNISYFGKSFRVNDGSHTVRMYDLAQFYEYAKLETVAEKYLNEHKKDSAQWVQHVIDYQNGKYTYKEVEDYLYNNYWAIGMYCQQDCKLTLKLADFIRNAYVNSGIAFDNPLSQAKLAELHIKKQTTYPNTVKPEYKEYEKFAQLSYHGGMFESLRTGFIDKEIHNYDINSAYPNVMYDLPNWFNGWFREVYEPSDYNFYGWYLTFFDCEHIPFPNHNIQEVELFFDTFEVKLPMSSYLIVYPEGWRCQVLTKPEIELMKRHGYKYKILKGVEWEQIDNRYKGPFEWIKPAYYKRLAIKKADKNDARQLALKKTYNSSYGKTAQHKKSIGALTNFFYASYITSMVRCQVAEIKIKYRKNMIEIATDGVYLDREIDLDIGENLGQWEHHVYKNGLILGSGMKQLFYHNPDKEGHTYETYLRGITNNRDYDLYDILDKNRHETKIPFVKNRPIKLGECLSQVHKLTLDDLNEFKNVKRELKINMDEKHKWSYTYQDFGDVLNKVSYASPFRVEDLKPWGKVFVPNIRPMTR